MSMLRKWSHLARFVVVGQDGIRGYPVGPGKWRIVGHGQSRVCHLRDGTTDYDVFKHIFVDPAYSLRRMFFRQKMASRYKAMLAGGKRPVIIDCGANNGCSALWFQLQYPEARVIAIEPERGNFEALRRNVEGSGVEAVHGAIAGKEQRVRVLANTNQTAFQTVEAEAGAVDAVMSRTIASLIGDRDELYIVKVDIEGFERDLFASNTDWIDDTALLVIELHDGLFPGTANSRPFFDALARSAPRDFAHRGENIFSLQI